MKIALRTVIAANPKTFLGRINMPNLFQKTPIVEANIIIDIMISTVKDEVKFSIRNFEGERRVYLVTSFIDFEE